MAVIGSLSVKLGLVTVEWDQATEKAKQQAKQLQKSFDELGGNIKTLTGYWKTLGGAVGAGALGFAALMQQTLEYSNQIKDLAQGFDISIAKVLQFQNAIKTSGGNAEGASKMLSTLFSKIEDAKSGNEAAISQFEKLGISFKELNQLKPEQAIDRIFNALNSGSLSTYQRVKMVKEMLGKQGIGLSIDEVAAKLNMSTAAYKKNEESVRKLGDVSDNLKTSMDNLKLAFADVIAPFTRDGVVGIEKFKAALYAIAAVTVISNLLKLVEVLTLVRKAMATNAALQASMAALGGAKGLALAGAAFATYQGAKMIYGADDEGTSTDKKSEREDEKKATDEKEQATRRELVAARAKVNLIREQINATKEEGQIKLDSLTTDKFDIALREVKLNKQRELAAAENERAQALNKENLSEAQRGFIGEEYAKKVELANEKAKQARLFINAQREKEIEIITRQRQFAQDAELFEKRRLDLESERVYMTDYEYKVANEQLQTEKKIADYEQQIIDAKSRLGAGKTFNDEKARIEDLIRGEKEVSAVRKEGLVAEEYRRTSFSEGWGSAFKKYAEDAQAYGKLGTDMFVSFTSNMNSAIDEFVKTGKLSFKNFAKSVIQDIIAMMLKFQAMQLLVASIKSLGLGGSPLMTGIVSMMGLPMKAEGGAIDGPAIVGEKGPELFIPKSAGTIIPNNRMQTAMGNNQTVNNYTINAIDTKSFEQRLLESPNAIWAANQYANKSLAVSRGRA